MRSVIWIVLATWFGLVCVLGAGGAFVRPSAAPPFPILIGAVGPLVVFFCAYLGWGAFRTAVRSPDLARLTSLHAWRAGGLGFLALAANGILPNAFAQPAGWGDIAIGLTAPWIALALARHPRLAAGRLFAAWNILGILDLVVAVSMGVLNSGFVPGMVGKVNTAAMARLPLVVIPAFFVPLYVMLHVTALIGARNRGLQQVPASRLAGLPGREEVASAV